MQNHEATPDSVPTDPFARTYAEARRLILTQNDPEAALRCLRVITPASKSNLWLWTDLVAALLFWKGQYGACCKVLISYRDRCPDDHNVTPIIQVLRQKYGCTDTAVDQSPPVNGRQ